MAHDVHFSIPSRSLGRADIAFQVYDEKEMIGTLKVSKGAVVWFPRGVSNGLKMMWKKFDMVMQANATQVEKR